MLLKGSLGKFSVQSCQNVYILKVKVEWLGFCIHTKMNLSNKEICSHKTVHLIPANLLSYSHVNDCDIHIFKVEQYYWLIKVISSYLHNNDLHSSVSTSSSKRPILLSSCLSCVHISSGRLSPTWTRRMRKREKLALAHNWSFRFKLSRAKYWACIIQRQ